MIDTLDEEPAAAMTPDTDTVTGRDGVSLDPESSAKRRKLRKGTRSCWECKRRKIRCIFAAPEDATCIGCQRRRAPCVSQEMPEDLAPAKKGNRHLGERITRVEEFMRDFLASKPINIPSQQREEEPWQGDPPNTAAPTAHSLYSVSSSVQTTLTPGESIGNSAPSSSLLTPDSQYEGLPVQGEAESTAVHRLLAAFPAAGDAQILLRGSARPSLYTDLINTQPHSRLTLETLAAPYPAATLPSPNTHPVLLAKQMLVFAITLQSPSGEQFPGLSEAPGILMRRLVTAATTWVTTKEEMHGTVESLICIMLEAVFQINSGNLRRAWAVYRRAMTVAQLMGLHRSPMPPLKRINPELDADPEFMWFRIVHMDRYLSLLLGLPQGTSDKSMGAPSALQHEPPLGRFERQLTVIASRILERNESDFVATEISLTQSIDADLLKVSKSMPASFWRPANFHNLARGSPGTLLETVRLAAQVYYYGLLIQLHLPYMMRIGENTEHEYSKITCVNASREIMTRFLAHRSFNPRSSCSRPVDFFALLGAMTLLLAHLDAHHHQEATNFLAHQRLSDLAMLDQALERMDVISNANKDVITGKSAKLIRRLLAIEADASEGNSYTANSVEADDDMQPDGDNTDEGEELRLHIPYLGVVKIAREGPISKLPAVEASGRHPYESNQIDSSRRGPHVTSQNSTLPHAHSASPTESSPLDHLHGMAQSSTLQPGGYQQSLLHYSGSSDDTISLQTHAGLPPITAGVDDWAFQGVDTAFFDSLMRGTSYMDPSGFPNP